MAGKRIKTRLARKKGFTLAETLLAILILLMVTAVVAAGIPVAANAYERVVMASNAQLLLSTTMTRMRDELGTATNITVGADNVTISYTADTGRNKSIHFAPGSKEGIKLTEYADAAVGDDNYEHLLVTAQAATQSLYATYDGVTYEGKGILKVENLQVKKKSDNSVIAEAGTFEISILTDHT